MEGGGEGGEGGEEGGAGGVTGGSAGARAHRARRRASARNKLANKPMDWQVYNQYLPVPPPLLPPLYCSSLQVRVHVLEARKLLGGQLNPIVKVVCGNAIKETSSRKGTNNPLFDEVHTHLCTLTQ